jgi:hypothetical protein
VQSSIQFLDESSNKHFMKHLLPLCLIVFFSVKLEGQNLYDTDHISTLELTIEAANWDSILDQYYSNDEGERLLATLVIDGVTFDSVGIRYKGNATYRPQNAKNPFNIKLDYVINQDYQGFETLKLSNGSHDPSFVREVLSYEIARKYMVAPFIQLLRGVYQRQLPRSVQQFRKYQW